MGYVTYQQLQTYTGLVFSQAQQAAATGLIDAASTWIDRYTGRTWQAASPVTDEPCALMLQAVGLRCYVKYRPVTSVTSVKLRSLLPDASVTTLSASSWELWDAAQGLILLDGTSTANLVALVTYAHTATTAPADVQLACSQIAGAWLTASLQPEALGVASLAVGQNDLSVTYRTDGHDVPPEARRILDQYRRVVIA